MFNLTILSIPLGPKLVLIASATAEKKNGESYFLHPEKQLIVIGGLTILFVIIDISWGLQLLDLLRFGTFPFWPDGWKIVVGY